MPESTLRAVDLFCGAGGLSWGLVEALKAAAMDADAPTEEVLTEYIDLVAVNHWDRAIETHQQNHPWARHFHDDVADVKPREVFDEQDPDVKVLSGGIECTHWSTARGGKPVDDQKRMPAWDVLTWVQKLQPEIFLFENVKEFARWGPIDSDGTPTRNGEIFDQWVDALHAHGYSVDWQVLNAADYGDATSRRRLFVVGTRSGRPAWPEPTHAEAPGPDSDRQPWRSAAEIIDWSDRGGSIWSRDLHDGRIQPLKYTTMRRIAEGIRRHCDDRLAPFADALEWIGRVTDSDDVDPAKFTSVEDLRANAVPAPLAPLAAEARDDPFLIDHAAMPLVGQQPFLTKYYGTSAARPLEAPLDTVTGGGQKFGLCVPTILGQHSNSVPRRVDGRPLPTVTTDGNIHFATPETVLLRQQSGGVPSSAAAPLPTVSGKGAIGRTDVQPLVLPKNGYQRGLHSNPLYPPSDQPHHTVTSAPRSSLVEPSLLRYSHGGGVREIARPLPTIATEKGGEYSLATPYLTPMYNGRDSQRPRSRAVDRPLMTVPASKSPAGVTTPLLQPFIDDYEGPAMGLGQPLGTITARDRFALVVPEAYPWGLDIRYRMLKPRELAAAQGFPPEYEFSGTKTEVTRQIGNAVPVNLAQALVESLLSRSQPSLLDFVDDQPASVSAAGDGNQTPSEPGVADD